MRNLLNPKWLFIINTIPIAILFFIYFGEYNIIKTLLKAENLRLWTIFGVSLVLLGVLNLIYTCSLIFKKKEVSKKTVDAEVSKAEKTSHKAEEAKAAESAVESDPEKKKGFMGNLRKFFKKEK